MTTKKAPLRAVSAGDAPASRPRAQTVAQAAASGDSRALLVAMRTRIAKSITDPKCSARDLAALTRRLQDISKEIEQLDLRDREEADGDDVAPDEAYDAEAL